MTTPDNRMETGVRDMLDARKQRGEREAIVYTGDWHDSIPRQLILDPQLTPTEKLIWQVLRTHASQPGKDGAWPSVARLAKLACVSRPTVQNAIDVLQAARWINVMRRIRDHRGAVIGNYYLLHGKPLPIHETMVIAPNYLQFLRNLSQANGPSKKRVKAFAIKMLQTLQQKVQAEQKQMNKLDELVEQMQVDPESKPTPVSQTLQKEADKIRDEQVATQLGKQKTTLVWPDALRGYKKKAMTLLLDAPEEHRQGILHAVGKAKNIRNPLAYLAAIIKKAQDGLFFDETAEEEQEEKKQASIIERAKDAKEALERHAIVTYKGKRVIGIDSALFSFENGYSCNIIRDGGDNPDDIVIEENTHDSG